MRGGKKLHLNWMHIFRIRLGQDVGLYASNLNSIYKGWREGILLRDLTNWLATLYKFGKLATKGRKTTTKCGKGPHTQ